jgi:hypothetical protein
MANGEGLHAIAQQLIIQLFWKFTKVDRRRYSDDGIIKFIAQLVKWSYSRTVT